MPLRIDFAEVFVSALLLDTVVLEFHLDVFHSIQRTKEFLERCGPETRFSFSSGVGPDAYLDGSIFVRWSEADPVTSLLISSQNCGPLHRFLPHFKSLLKVEATAPTVRSIEKGGFFEALNEFNRRFYAEEEEASHAGLIELEACVAGQCYCGGVAAYRQRDRFTVEVATFPPNLRVASLTVDPAELAAALDVIQKRNVEYVLSRIEMAAN